MVEFEINAGDELPRKQAARRIPYAVHQEVAEQLERMQQTGHHDQVQLCLLDGTLRYTLLNSVTKPDVFLLPRSDNY